MSQAAYNEAAPADKQHFIKCGACGEMIDMRSLDEVFSHETDHQPHPDIQYAGSRRLA